MAGRGGRGRGKGALSFQVESLGFGRGQSLPETILQPPPLFPPLEFKPLPVATGEEYEYLLALKQEFRTAMQESPYYIRATEKKNHIRRYSDKYNAQAQETASAWKPEWSHFPEELRPKVRQKRKAGSDGTPNLPKKLTAENKEQLKKTLDELEIKEGQEVEEEGEEGEEKKKKKEGEEGEEVEADEEEYYEDDMEEETDYNVNYFDNGEEDGDAGEDDEEGPVY